VLPASVPPSAGPVLGATGNAPSPAPVLPTLPSDAARPAPPTQTVSGEGAWEKSAPVQKTSLTTEQRSAPSVAATNAAPPPAPVGAPGRGRQVASSTQPKGINAPAAPLSGSRLGRGAPGVVLTNSTHISLEYEVSRMGPSGLAKVELYVTPDDGRTWQLLTNDPKLMSPISAELPGEGVFGLTLVLTNGAGHGRKP